MLVAESVRTPVRYPILDRLLEAGWLAAVFLVPVVVAHDQFMVGFVQMAKVGLFRTIVVFVLAVAVLRWGLEWRAAPADLGSQLAGLRRHPAGLLFLGAGAVLVANLVSLAFSPVKSIGVWGLDPGWDSYGLLSIASYLAVFGVVAAHLRTADQVRRLLWTIVAAAVVVSLYGIGQHFGFDPYRTDAGPARRANLSFGNPIFAGSFLVIAIPITIAAVLSLRDTLSPARHVALGVALLAPQMTAMLFTLSRGPWVGLAAGLVVLLALVLWLARPHLVRTVVMLAAVGVVAFGLSALPVPGGGGGPDDVVDRVGSIAPEIGAGMTHRWTNWTTAAEVFVTVPWVDTEEFPGVPDLGLRPLRPLIGYGPDMYGYAYPLAGEETYTFELATHGHNFIVHTALELGLLGVAAYLFMAGAAWLVIYRLFRAVRRGEAPGWYLLVLVGLSSAFAGRMVEQIPGKAQVSDLMLSWMLAGLLVGLTMLRTAENGPDSSPVERRRARPRRVPRAAASSAPLSVPRVAAASAVVLVLVLFWTLHVAAPVSAAVVTADARRSAATDTQLTFDTYERAIERYPSWAAPRFQAAQLVFQVAQNTEDPEERENLMRYAYEQVQAVLARNPLDHRALSAAAEYRRELAVLGAVDPEDSVHEARALVAVMPGFWQSYATLAWSHLRLGDVESALGAIEQAKERDNGTAQTGLIYYLEALALRELGRHDEALEAVETSLERQHSRDAERLLEELEIEMGVTEGE